MTEFAVGGRPSLGPLAAALAKARVDFPTITRDKKVTVQTKTGGSYSFMYAPLDSILNAVTGPLSANGLVIVQTLDEGGLVTMLLHESGAYIDGRVELPNNVDIQGLGSAVTYLRRYAIQAMLGIAAEEDDDGNRAAGNTVKADVEKGDDGSLIGTVEVGDRTSSDFMVRNTPDGPALGFRLRGAKGGILVETKGPLAVQLNANKDAVVGQRVTVWGNVTPRSFTPKGSTRQTNYVVMAADRVRVPEIGDLPEDADYAAEKLRHPSDAAMDVASGITEAESEAIWASLEEAAGA